LSDVAIISGGGNGIGRSVALRFARAGIAVAIADADREGAERVVGELTAAGARARAYAVDVTRSADIGDVVARVHADFGGIDILANLAGGTIHTKAVEDLSWAEWREVMDVNLKGTFLFCRQVAPLMMEQGRGRIVNTASNYGLTGCALRTPYSAAKSGIIGFSKSLAQELAPHGVLVNVVAPGPTDTPRVLAHAAPGSREAWKPLIPMGRTGQPEDIAEGFYFLVSPENTYITGYTLNVNGGLVMN
jgi:NAD(P)-dependent dehydrogenase (short-subunit alcohol dehydrogenase family)